MLMDVKVIGWVIVAIFCSDALDSWPRLRGLGLEW